MANTYSFGEAGPISAREGSKAQIRVTRSGTLGDGAAIVMATNGSAVADVASLANSDYDLGSGNPGGTGFWLNFYGSETEKVLEIPIQADSISEPTEDFFISIVSGSGSSDSVTGPTEVKVIIPKFLLPFGGDGGKPHGGGGDGGRPHGGGGDGGRPHVGGGDGGKPPVGGGDGGKPPVGGGHGGKPPVGGGDGGKPPVGGGDGGKPPVGGGKGQPPFGGDESDSQVMPSITGAAFDGNSIEIEFDDIIAPGNINKKLFTVRVNGRRATVLSATVADDDFIASLELSKEIPADSDVKVSYKDLKGDQVSGVLQSIDGLDLPSFTNYTVESFF